MGDETQNPEDRSDEKLTPKKAYNLTENQGYLGKVVADMYDVTPGYVSQLKGEYKEALETGKERGREEVEPTDFDAERLEDALNDKADDEKYTKAPCCGSRIPTPDEAGQHDCPKCGTTLKFNESEV